MATAIRKHLRDFIAVAGLIVIALAVTGYLVQKQRLRIRITVLVGHIDVRRLNSVEPRKLQQLAILPQAAASGACSGVWSS